MTTPDDYPAFRARCAASPPEVFLVLGSGLNAGATRLVEVASLPFASVPGLPAAGVAGHKGRFVLGTWAGRVVLVGEGRLHYYEGHPWDVVVRPVEVAAELGAKTLILTNAAGGIRDDLAPGSLMPLRAHVEYNAPGARSAPAAEWEYDAALVEAVVAAGGANAPGVYASVTGPNYETRSDILALRSLGADAVGMSTTREARRGTELGMRVAAISLVTNRAAGLSAGKLDHGEVLAEGKAAAGRLAALLEEVLRRTAPACPLPPARDMR